MGLFYARRLQEENAEGTDLPGEASAPVESAEVSEDSSVNWEDFISDSESEVEGDELVVETEAEGLAVEAEPEVVKATPPVAPPPVVPPQVATEAPPAPAPVDPAAQAESYRGWREAHLVELEKQYALNEADAVAALTDPEKVLPALAAKVHLSVMENSMRAVQAMLPTMLGQFQQGNDLNMRAKNLFVSENPDLADPQYEGAILQLGQVYRSMNRGAAPDVAARAIGSLVRAAFGLVQPSAVGQTAPAQTFPAKTGFVPARGSGGSVRISPSSNVFEQMADEMLRDPDF